MTDDEQRYRLVVLGAGRVGKSSIVSRFLHDKYVESYKPTVEDLHCRTLHADGSVIQVNCSGSVVLYDKARAYIYTTYYIFRRVRTYSDVFCVRIHCIRRRQ